MTVIIVNSGADGANVSASGLVTGEAGDKGVCILTATAADGNVLEARMDAQPTPAAMNCGLIEVPAPAGEWTLVLSYWSDSAAASSDPVKVEQP